jgi:hypothetical protein
MTGGKACRRIRDSFLLAVYILAFPSLNPHGVSTYLYLETMGIVRVSTLRGGSPLLERLTLGN